MSAVKRAVKRVGKFLKKHWVKIAIAAAVVLTAGIATVGVAGFSSAMGAASAAGASSFGAFVSAAGSTMAAGVASIGGTLGIGQGANLAAFGGSGYATLGTGAAAQSLGLAGSNAAMTAGNLARTAPSAALGGGPPAALAGQAGSTAVTQGGRTVIQAAPSSLSGGAASTASNAGGTGGTSNAAGGASNWRTNPNTGMMLQAGMGLVSNYMQGRADEEDWERTKPRGFWGVGLNGTPDRAGPMVPGGLMWNADSLRNPQARNAIGPNMAMEPGSQVDPYTGEVIADTPLPYDPQQGAPTRGRI